MILLVYDLDNHIVLIVIEDEVVMTALAMAGTNTIKVGLSVSPLRLHFRPPLIKCNSLSFQDFQGYAKPSRLLSTKHLKVLRDEQPDSIISALQSDASISLYKLLLCTSSFYGSDLSDQRAAVLVCIIDQYGDSILERIPSIHCSDQYDDDVFRFQRGSKDEFVFWGPKLARIQSIWISPDSGNWRLGGASLTIIGAHDHQEEEISPNGITYQSTNYYFEVDDVLLGEGSDLSMLELCPCMVTEHHGDDSISNIYENSSQVGSPAEKEIAKEESLREYTNLKYSLLLYDSVLVFAGTSIASITGGENTALAFLTGGIGGFLYLLLLQRSVDTLQAPEVNVSSTGNSFNSLFQGVKGPIVLFTFACVVALLATKYDKPDVIAALTPREILAGLIGFLACKISVVLAAFKPVSKGLEENK